MPLGFADGNCPSSRRWCSSRPPNQPAGIRSTVPPARRSLRHQTMTRTRRGAATTRGSSRKGSTTPATIKPVMQTRTPATQTGDPRLRPGGPAALDRQAIARWEGEGGAMFTRHGPHHTTGTRQKSCLPRIRTIPVRGGNRQHGFAVRLTACFAGSERKLEVGQHGITFQ